MSSLSEILAKYWGYASFRPLQEDIIRSVLDGHDTLGLMPTGGGKSLTFQVPALMLPHLTLVVTPLISLMKDQIDNLREHGVKAAAIHSGLSRREQRLAIDRAMLGKIKLLYLSPEKLHSRQFTDLLHSLAVSLIVVDEAHCISQWGYDFRPSYLQIAQVRKFFPHVPILALTASATPEVAIDIGRQLNFSNANIFTKSFNRSNLSYIVRHDDVKPERLLKVLRATTGSAIVYVRSRRRTREIAEMLSSNGIEALYYHAGLSPEEKTDRQNKWKSGQVRVMVATNAFGMGIDKPDVRVVVHIDLPSSLEEYYQEAGRAGRDGLPAFAVVIASRADKGLLTRRLSEAFPDKGFIRRVYELAGNFLNVAVGEGYNHLYDFDFNLFCERFRLPPAPTRSALTLLTRAGAIEYVDEVETRSRIMVIAHKSELYGLELDEVTETVFQYFLRTYTGLFADYVYISESAASRRLGYTEQQIYESLLKLSRLHAIHYVPHSSTPYVLYTTSRELPKHVVIPRAVYEDMRERMEARLDAMKRFVYDASCCRVTTLLSYFGEKHSEDCGRCDVCRARKARQRPVCQSVEEGILYLASQPGGHTVKYIADNLLVKLDDVTDCVRKLLDDGLVAIDHSGNVVKQ